jgi:hypothetical protein
MPEPTFQLQFDPSQIATWAAEYDAAGDDAALAAGRRIGSGDFDADKDLQIIVEWKAGRRPLHHLSANKTPEKAEALRLAITAKTDRSAVAILTGLSGVSVPVASAILAVLNPDRFTVIDFRSLEALGIPRTMTDRSIGLYLHYLAFCRPFAKKA